MIYNIKKMNILLVLTYYLLTLLIFNCKSSEGQIQQANGKNLFLAGDFLTSLSKFREGYQKADNADKLLMLMEAGIVAHTMSDYEKSIQILKDAETITDSQITSVSAETLAFLSNDGNKEFRPENFEIVLIKFYIALNYTLLGKYDEAKRYFKKIEFDLSNMKVDEPNFKQILVARMLDAIVSESIGKFNDARVEWKNIGEFTNNSPLFLENRFILAVKENDKQDLKKFEAGKKSIKAFDKNLKPIPYQQKLGEVIIINQAGLAPIKKSRGTINDEPFFKELLLQVVVNELTARGDVNLTPAAVLYAIGQSENPIPEYKIIDTIAAAPQEIFVNNTSLGNLFTLTDYSKITIANFNDNYKAIVQKSVASIATKAVAAIVAAEAAKKNAQVIKDQAYNQCSRAGNDFLVSACQVVADKAFDAAIGYAAGKIAGSLVGPDTRTWGLLPSNFQVQRIFLEPGEYEFGFNVYGSNSGRIRTESVLVKVEAGKPIFLNLRTVNNGNL